VSAGQQPFVLQVGDVLVDRRQRTKIEAVSDLFKGRGVPVPLHESRDKFQDFFLPAGNGHSRHYSEQKANRRKKFSNGGLFLFPNLIRRRRRVPLPESALEFSHISL
jgi:hypothetical protein